MHQSSRHSLQSHAGLAVPGAALCTWNCWLHSTLGHGAQKLPGWQFNLKLASLTGGWGPQLPGSLGILFYFPFAIYEACASVTFDNLPGRTSLLLLSGKAWSYSALGSLLGKDLDSLIFSDDTATLDHPKKGRSFLSRVNRPSASGAVSDATTETIFSMLVVVWALSLKPGAAAALPSLQVCGARLATRSCTCSVRKHPASFAIALPAPWFY